MAPKPPKQTQKLLKFDSTLSPSEQANEEANSASEAPAGTGVTTDSNKILTAIQALKDDFAARLDGLLSAVQGLKADVKAVIVRVTEAEDRIGANQDDIASLLADNTSMKATIKELAFKVDDLENRSRRSNLRLVGIPEGKEGADMCMYLEGWLPKVLGADTFPSPLLIERAHRLGRANKASRANSGGPQQSARLRVVIMKRLNYADKTRIIRAARLKGPILLDNQRIMFFPDVSADLLKRRKAFDPVKKDLAALSIPTLRYGVAHPATLLITFKGKRHTFDTVKAAEDFVKEIRNQQHEECG